MTEITPQAIAFAGQRLIARGPLATVGLAAKAALDAGEQAPVLVFDGIARPVEIDFRGRPNDVASRLAAMVAPPETEEDSSRKPGRPKLGVIAKEVTLLPRHWDWLATQPGGASATLRRLIETARRASEGQDKIRAAQEAAFRFMTALGGNEPEFDNAIRALFSSNLKEFQRHMTAWPGDIAEEALRLAAPAFRSGADN